MNCTVDVGDAIKIPQNRECFFIIEKSNNWKNSIEIRFNKDEPTDMINLFLILKSYVFYKLCPPHTFSIGYKNHEKTIIYQTDSTNFIKELNFINFSEWMQFRMKNDWKYQTDTKFYSILLVFDEKLVSLQKQQKFVNFLDKLKPIYPWKTDWLETFKNQIARERILLKIIEGLKEDILRLRKNPDT